jgi:hypothetical protein
MQYNIHTNNVPLDFVQKIAEFDDEGFSYYLRDPFTFNSAILFGSDGKILGAGVIRVVNEFKMSLDPNLSNLQKAKALKILMKLALEHAQCNEILGVITKGGLSYTKILKDHYGFEFQPGILLKLER